MTAPPELAAWRTRALTVAAVFALLTLLFAFSHDGRNHILRAYQDAHPLADGWPSRVPLHQLHPLLVHCCLFGPTYAPSLRSAAHSALHP